MSETHEGGCLCGRVRYRTRGQPLRTLVCHCSFCQKFTGSSFNVESMFADEAVEFFAEMPRRYSHPTDDGSRQAHIHFCGHCGTTVSLTFDRSPGIRCISRGTFDDTNWVSVTAHIWTRSAQSGVALPAHIDCFRCGRIALDGTPQPAERFEHPVMAIDDA